MDQKANLGKTATVTRKGLSDYVIAKCRKARELEDSGNYEAAANLIADLWPGVEQAPKLDGLELDAAADVLLSVGSLTGWIGSAQQIAGAQERAKNYLTNAISIFESLGFGIRVAEAKAELAWCYWREGAFFEALDILLEIKDSVAGEGDAAELRCNVVLRIAII